jgi:16S rRNA (cytosine967-C5)-methyltransferase
MNKNSTNVRVAAAKIIAAVLNNEASLATLIPQYNDKIAERDRGLLQELCFGTLRYYPKFETILGKLLKKPLQPKDSDVQALLACALYQLLETRIPPHAAISESVNATRGLKKQWAKGFTNGVLRNFQRQQNELLSQLANNPYVKTSHPTWLQKAINKAWPDQAAAIFEANNGRPPLTLRINRTKTSREQYAERLTTAGIEFSLCEFSADGITLKSATDITQLPNFEAGWLSVQDEAAQLSAQILDLQPTLRVLDACCAPGGKTCHMLEQQPSLEMVALDVDEMRLQRVSENLARLQLNAQLIAGDAAATDEWWDGKLFDRILLDAPCSATGVIRRHPDIKMLRRPADIAKLSDIQAQLLRAMWPLLKPGGLLLYATCSILPDENNVLVSDFIDQQSDANVVPLHVDWGQRTDTGRQLFPTNGSHDGFYYALLRKR